MKLISFDIDGTLEAGDPPGIITMDMVRAIKALGYVIGSGSDRTLLSQRHIWEHHRVVVDFTVLKHQLADLKARGKTIIAVTHDERFWHVADRVVRLDLGAVLWERPGASWHNG